MPPVELCRDRVHVLGLSLATVHLVGHLSTGFELRLSVLPLVCAAEGHFSARGRGPRRTCTHPEGTSIWCHPLRTMKIRLTENAKRKLADTRALGEVALSQNGSERSISLQVPLVNHVPLPLAVAVHAQSRCIGSAHLVIASPTAGGVVGTLSMLERRQTSRVRHESDGTVLLRLPDIQWTALLCSQVSPNSTPASCGEHTHPLTVFSMDCLSDSVFDPRETCTRVRRSSE